MAFCPSARHVLAVATQDVHFDNATVWYNEGKFRRKCAFNVRFSMMRRVSAVIGFEVHVGRLRASVELVRWWHSAGTARAAARIPVHVANLLRFLD